MAGNKIDKIPKDKINKQLERILLAIVLILMMALSWKSNTYDIVLSVLTKGANADSFVDWYIAPIAYFATFICTVVVSVLVINAVPEKNRWLEKHGVDTLPMYLSHLILFMAVSYVINNNWELKVGISCVCIVFSILLFSTGWYRKIFNSVMNKIKNIAMMNSIR